MKLEKREVIQKELWHYDNLDERQQKQEEMNKDGWTLNYKDSNYDHLYDYFERVVISENFRSQGGSKQ